MSEAEEVLADAHRVANDLLQAAIRDAYEVERAARMKATMDYYAAVQKVKEHESEPYHVLNIWKIG